jgi:hypothetical protein
MIRDASDWIQYKKQTRIAQNYANGNPDNRIPLAWWEKYGNNFRLDYLEGLRKCLEAGCQGGSFNAGPVGENPIEGGGGGGGDIIVNVLCPGGVLPSPISTIPPGGAPFRIINEDSGFTLDITIAYIGGGGLSITLLPGQLSGILTNVESATITNCTPAIAPPG